MALTSGQPGSPAARGSRGVGTHGSGVTMRERPVLAEACAMSATPSDGDLLVRITGGDEAAMSALVERYRRPALALAGRLCGTALAEEVVQDAYMAVWRAAGTYRPGLASVRSWLLGIVRHRAIDALRRDSRHTRHRADSEALQFIAQEDDAQPHALVTDAERSRTLRSMLDALPSDQAQVIGLAYFDELSHPEIAEMTGLPMGTVKSRIRLGLKKLRAPLMVNGAA
jgi:RNA polymerase sigma-70 factor (ECF subfamily)